MTEGEGLQAGEHCSFKERGSCDDRPGCDCPQWSLPEAAGSGLA